MHVLLVKTQRISFVKLLSVVVRDTKISAFLLFKLNTLEIVNKMTQTACRYDNFIKRYKPLYVVLSVDILRVT